VRQVDWKLGFAVEGAIPAVHFILSLSRSNSPHGCFSLPQLKETRDGGWSLDLLELQKGLFFCFIFPCEAESLVDKIFLLGT